MRAVPIVLLETCMLFLEIQREGCLTNGGGAPICHAHKLQLELASK